MNEYERARLRALWAAVLATAIVDFLGDSHRDSAEHWIFDAPPLGGGVVNSFGSVCDLLDIDAGRVRSRVRMMRDAVSGGSTLRDVLGTISVGALRYV